MVSLSLTYNNKEYKALVTEQVFNDKKQYRVTIMNGELEKLIHGHNIFIENDNEVKENTDLPEELQSLRSSIKQSLIQYLQQTV